jgi:hypothetical protein
MDYKEELDLARERVDRFTTRYSGKDYSFEPIRTAIEWQKIFESPEPNLDDARKVVARAINRKHEYDLAFFAFLNHLERVLREMVKDSLIQ